MTLPQIIVLLVTLLALAGEIRLYAKLCAERAKRIEAIQKLLGVRAELEEWVSNADFNLRAWQVLTAKTAKLRQEMTAQAVQIDSMLHGDRCCVEGHRYYTGQGISCPHCSAEEEELKKCDCGALATVSEYGRWYCSACYIPF